MEQIENLGGAKTFKVLGDQRRVDILRLLMKEPATLSQLGDKMKMHPAKVRYHLKQLEEHGLVSLTSTREVRGFVEKYYQASAHAYRVEMSILPRLEEESTLLAIGSHDLALELLAFTLREQNPKQSFYTLPIGSMDGLIALRQGIGQMAGAHLFDPATSEYNLPFVRHLFPDRPMRVMTLVHREQGLITAPGNPLHLKNLQDLLQPSVRMVNRNRGSGTRLWIDTELKKQGIPTGNIVGYNWEVSTHVQVAEAIVNGQADVGVGLYAAASKFGLGFQPLFEERYDLVIPEEYFSSPLLAPSLDYIHTAQFREKTAQLGGYNTAQAGNEQDLV